jgi:hypothetical protein
MCLCSQLPSPLRFLETTVQLLPCYYRQAMQYLLQQDIPSPCTTWRFPPTSPSSISNMYRSYFSLSNFPIYLDTIKPYPCSYVKLCDPDDAPHFRPALPCSTVGLEIGRSATHQWRVRGCAKRWKFMRWILVQLDGRRGGDCCGDVLHT